MTTEVSFLYSFVTCTPPLQFSQGGKNNFCEMFDLPGEKALSG